MQLELAIGFIGSLEPGTPHQVAIAESAQSGHHIYLSDIDHHRVDEYKK